MNAALSKTDVFTMAGLRRRSTGLRNNVWIGPRGRARRAAHILVQTDRRWQLEIDHLAAVSVEDDPPRLLEGALDDADLAQVRRWIVLNRAAILDHWHGRTDGADLARVLRPLPAGR
jgi:hypothetical protein